jgi:hypothetical protein
VDRQIDQYLRTAWSNETALEFTFGFIYSGQIYNGPWAHKNDQPEVAQNSNKYKGKRVISSDVLQTRQSD